VGALAHAAYFAVGVLSARLGWFVGCYRTRPAVEWDFVVGAVGAGVAAWQAIILGRVPEEEEGELHEE